MRGFAWLVKNRRRHENDLSPMADFAPLLGEPDPSRSTVAEARRMLHDELSAPELQKEWEYRPASLLSLGLEAALRSCWPRRRERAAALVFPVL